MPRCLHFNRIGKLTYVKHLTRPLTTETMGLPVCYASMLATEKPGGEPANAASYSSLLLANGLDVHLLISLFAMDLPTVGSPTQNI